MPKVTITERKGMFTARVRGPRKTLGKFSHLNLYQLIALVVERWPLAEFNRSEYQRIADGLRLSRKGPRGGVYGG